MGRAARKSASSAEPREHWTDTHPDRKMWSPARLAIARTQTQEEYEALYGRGEVSVEPFTETEEGILIPEKPGPAISLSQARRSEKPMPIVRVLENGIEIGSTGDGHLHLSGHQQEVLREILEKLTGQKAKKHDLADLLEGQDFIEESPLLTADPGESQKDFIRRVVYSMGLRKKFFVGREARINCRVLYNYRDENGGISGLSELGATDELLQRGCTWFAPALHEEQADLFRAVGQAGRATLFMDPRGSFVLTESGNNSRQGAQRREVAAGSVSDGRIYIRTSPDYSYLSLEAAKLLLGLFDGKSV